MSPRLKTLHSRLAWLIAIAVLLWYGLTLQDSQDWGGDWALYVSHAANLATGQSYGDTPYYTDQWSYVAPALYPPVLPLVLSVLHRIFELNLVAFKFVYILCFAGSLVLAFHCFKERASSLGALFIVLLLALNPFFWRFKESILSDVPFLFVCLLNLRVMQVLYARGAKGLGVKGLLPGALALGLCMYLGYGLREIGLVLPLTALAYELVVLRKLTPISLASIPILLLFAWWQHSFLQTPPGAPHVEQQLAALSNEAGREYSHLNFFHFEPHFLWKQFWLYKRTMWGFFCHGIGEPPRLIAELGRLMTHAVTALGLLGFALSLRQRISVLEIFCAGYFLVILSFSGFHGIRYLIPLLPFVVYYACLGARWIPQKLSPLLRTPLVASLGLAASVLYGYSFATGPSLRLEQGVRGPAAQEVWDYLTQHAEPDDIVVSRKPRIVGLMTQLRSCTFPKVKQVEAYTEYFEIVGVDYVLNLQILPNETPFRHPKLPVKIEKMLDGRLVEVLRNDYFQLFEYRSPALQGADSPADPQDPH